VARRRIPRRTSAIAAAAAALSLFAGPVAEANPLSVTFVSSQAVEVNIDPPADGYVGPGDVIALTPTIHNAGGTTLSGLTGRLILPDDGSILQNDTTFGTVLAGTDRAGQTPFKVALVTGRECGRPLRFKMSVRSGDDSTELPFSVPTGGPGGAVTKAYDGVPVQVAPGSVRIAGIDVPALGLAKSVSVHVGRLDAAQLGALSLTLISPAGDAVPLMVQKGGSASGLADATFAATGDPVPAGQAGVPLSGSFQAEGDLGVLDGATIGGQWQLAVSGSSSAQVSDVLKSWDITIAPAICQPQMIASITPSTTVVSVGGQVDFDATASVPGDDAHPITKYEWDLDGDGQWDPGVTGPKVSSTYASRGAVNVGLRVSDDAGRSVTTTQLVSVTERPTAAVTTSPAPDVTAGEPITLDATGSAADPAGHLERYEWDLNGDGLYEVDGHTSPTLTTHFDKDGPHTVGVRVTDDARATATATATFTVDDRPPDVVLTVPQPAVAGQAVTLDASGTTDLEKDPLAFSWDPEDDGSFAAGSSTLTTTFTTVGVQHVSVRVDDGQATTTKRVAVVVTTAPLAALSAPATARPGQLVTLDATTSHDDEGPIAAYAWDLDGNGTFEQDTGATPATTVSWPDRGDHTVRVRVTDGDGATAVRGATVTVQNLLPQAVLAASAGSVQTGGEVVFDASASSDPDGQVVRYDWDLDGNGSFETPGGAAATVRRSFPNAVDLRPRVRVTDNEGGEGIASVLVHIVAPAVVAPVTPVSPADPAPPLFGDAGAGDGATATAAGAASGPASAKGGAGAKGAGGAGAAAGGGGGASGTGGGPPAFRAGLAGATVQRARAVRRAGLKLRCQADRSVTCSLTAVVRAKDAKRLHLVTGRRARSLKVGVRTVRTKGRRAAGAAFRLPKALARQLARGRRAVVVVTGTATDARGRKVTLKRSITLKR
jgi:PKD domain-containing protein/proprotein convertase P-domain-containing protein